MSTQTNDQSRVGALSTWTLVLSLFAGVLYAVPKLVPDLMGSTLSFWLPLVPAAFALDITVALMVVRGRKRGGGRKAVLAIVLGLLATAVILVPDLFSLAQLVLSFIHGKQAV